MSIMKRSLIAAALLACAMDAQAAGTWYFDSSCATPGDGTTNVCSGATAPFDQLSDRVYASGDRLMLKGTFNEALTLTNISNIRVGVWGYTIIDGQNSRNYAISADRVNNLVVSGYLNKQRGNLELRNAVRNGFFGYTVTASNTTRNQKIEGTYIHDIGPGIRSPASENDLEVGTCLLFRGTNTSTGTAILDGAVAHDNIIENCGKHGIDFRYRVLNFAATSNTCSQAGLTATGHCISTHPFNQNSWSPAWTDADGAGAGTVYYHDILSVNDTDQRMVNYTTSTILTKVASTTTPAVGEWSRTSAGVGACTGAAANGCLYVNTGGVVTSQVIVFKRHAHGPFKIVGNTTFESQSGVDTAEGHGIDADDLSGPGVIAQNWSYDNYGTGIQVFYGENIRMNGNVVNDNGRQGINIYACTNCIADANTAVSNGDLGIYGGGVTSTGVKLRNNIAYGNQTRGISMNSATAADPGFTSASNISWANVTNNACSNVTCTLSDPGILADPDSTSIRRFCVEENGPAWGTGTYVGAWSVDFFGASDNPPNIGALGKSCGARTH